MNKNQLKNILNLLHLAEKLKMETRHSWLSNGRKESTAEHSWRVSLMAILFEPYLSQTIDLEKALKIAVIHDLVEAEAYDVPAFEHHRKEEKQQAEKKAIEKIKDILSDDVGENIYNLWYEYENSSSFEARYIKALDKIECRLQHNEAGTKTWNDVEFPRSLFAADKYVEFEKTLSDFNQIVKDDSKKLIEKSQRNFTDIADEAEQLSS